MELEVYSLQEDVLRALTLQLMKQIELTEGDFHLALSGGGTAQEMFRFWQSEFGDPIFWRQVKFYWVDERCVAPADKESNFKYAQELFFSPLGIAAARIYRICGEKEPEEEARRYSTLVTQQLPQRNELSQFSAIILGIGDDGHVASLFPEEENLFMDERCYVVAQHPLSGQKRITMTGLLILAARSVLIPVLGSSKANILQKVVHATGAMLLPASYVLAHGKYVKIFTDVQIEV